MQAMKEHAQGILIIAEFISPDGAKKAELLLDLQVFKELRDERALSVDTARAVRLFRSDGDTCNYYANSLNSSVQLPTACTIIVGSNKPAVEFSIGGMIAEPIYSFLCTA